MNALTEFERLHRHRKDQDHQRLGQRFVNMFIKHSWPELFYKEDYFVAREMIRQWLSDNCHVDALPLTKDQREINMYGVSVEHINEAIRSAKSNGVRKDRFVMSILSDSQELISLRKIDQANQKINLSKYCLDNWDDVK